MARPLRIEYAGAFYHITARGNERKDIFKSVVWHGRIGRLPGEPLVERGYEPWFRTKGKDRRDQGRTGLVNV